MEGLPWKKHGMSWPDFFHVYLPFKIWKATNSPLLNKILFPLRKRIRWSKGRPDLAHESKDGLFRFLMEGEEAALLREADLRSRFHLAEFSGASPRVVYRRNLEALEYLEAATEGLVLIPGQADSVKALDIGSRTWEYVIGLEKWLRHRDGSGPRQVALHGIELDGYMLLPDLHSVRDFALRFVELTGNPGVTYEVADLLQLEGGGYDIITHFYPLVRRKNVISMGLPAEFLAPEKMLAKAADLTKAGGHLVVFNHFAEEQDIFCELARASRQYEMLRRGRVRNLFLGPDENHESGYYSVWKKSSA